MSDGSRWLFEALYEELLGSFVGYAPNGKKPEDVVCVTIVDDQRGEIYTVASRKTKLVCMAWVGIIRASTHLHRIGMHLDCRLGHPGVFPPRGTVVNMRLSNYLWPSIAASFLERGIAKVTHLGEKQYHPDIQALLDACNNRQVIRMTFL